MAAEKGNTYWKLAKGFGQGAEPNYTPVELWEKAIEYFEWVEENPLFETKAFAYQGMVTTEQLPKMRAMSILGFCLFAGIVDTIYYNYRKKDAYRGICAKIESVIRTQKFEGASAELLNPAIISRDLGLVDKVQSSNVNKSQVIVLSPEDAAQEQAMIDKFNLELSGDMNEDNEGL